MDRDLRGFGVGVYASGRKVYVVQTRGPAGGLKRVNIGRDVKMTADAARRTARKVIDRTRSEPGQARTRSRRRRGKRR